MSGRSGVRLAVGILAVFAGGCGSSRSFSLFQAPASQPGVVARAADKNPPGPIDNRYAPPAGPSASSSWPPVGGLPTAHRLPVTPAPTWPSPEYNRAGYGEELAAGQMTGQPTGQPAPLPLGGQPGSAPLSVPRPTVNPTEYYGGGYGAAVPTAANVRQMPTATGGRLELGPHETPMDRAVELARRIDEVNGENMKLLVRIRQLEAAAEARETALNETLRDVQNASDEVARTRTELQAVRKDLAALKARVLQVEKDETETLKAVIAAIEKLLQQPLPPSDNGGKK